MNCQSTRINLVSLSLFDYKNTRPGTVKQTTVMCYITTIMVLPFIIGSILTFNRIKVCIYRMIPTRNNENE